MGRYLRYLVLLFAVFCGINVGFTSYNSLDNEVKNHIEEKTVDVKKLPNSELNEKSHILSFSNLSSTNCTSFYEKLEDGDDLIFEIEGLDFLDVLSPSNRYTILHKEWEEEEDGFIATKIRIFSGDNYIVKRVIVRSWDRNYDNVTLVETNGYGEIINDVSDAAKKIFGWNDRPALGIEFDSSNASNTNSYELMFSNVYGRTSELYQIAVVYEHKHNFNNDYQQDQTNHWQLCDCGGISASIEHTWKIKDLSHATFDAPGQSTLICEVCDYEKIETLFLTFDKLVIEPVNTLIYNGQEQTLNLNVYYELLLLEEGKHYTISNNVQKDAGDYTLTVTGAGGFEGERTLDYTIAKAPLKITVDNKEVIYGDEIPTYTVTYEGFVNGETEEVLTGELSFSCDYEQFDDVGEYIISANGYESNNYEITYETGNLNVKPKEVTLAWENTTLTYNGEEQKPSVRLEGLVGEDTCDIEVEASGVNAGTHIATFIGVIDSNYILTSSSSTEYKINPKSIEGAVVTLGDSLYYTGEEQTQEVVSVVLDGVELIYSADYKILNNKVIEAGKHILTIEGKGNYTGNVEVEFVMNKAQLIVTVENQKVTYGDEAPTYTVTYEGFLSGDNESILNGELSFSCEYIPGSNVGEYTITAEGLINDNYDIIYVNGKLTVNKKIVSIPNIKTDCYYNGSEHTLLTSTDLYTVSGDYIKTEVGEYLAILTLVDPEHYKWEDDTFNGEIEWSITLKEYDMSGVSFNNKTVVYDGTNHALKITGNLPEGISVSYSITECIEPGVYEIIATFDGEDLTYYKEIADMKATLTIKQVQLKVESNFDEGDENYIFVSSPNGVQPNIIIYAETIDLNENYYLQFLNNNQKAVAAYDIKLFDKDGNLVQPESELIIKLLIPKELTNHSFEIMHIHNDGEKSMIEYTIEGDYVVFKINKLSYFFFVQNTQSFVGPLVVVSIVVLLVTLFIFNSKRRYKKI